MALSEDADGCHRRVTKRCDADPRFAVSKFLPAIEAAADGERPRDPQQCTRTRAGLTIMANDADWVEDVKRWALSSARSSEPALNDAAAADEVALGVEAAQPALQARHWPDAPTKDR